MSHLRGSDQGDQIERLLRAHAFEDLFIEELGWDRFTAPLRIESKGDTFSLTPIAQKRDLAVYQCELDRLALRDRRRLRAIQAVVRRYAFEHLLIYTDADQTTQVWQWATVAEGGRSLLHREHPVHSQRPPPEFVDRVRALRVDLADEPRVTLSDVTANVAGAFDRAAAQRMFFRNTTYLYESERLAAELATGGEPALHRFIEFHDGLARWGARRYRYTGVDIEDLEQMARMGLMRAATLFEPQRRLAFSTYAFSWLRSHCQRNLQAYVFHGMLRPDQFWRFMRLKRRLGRRPSGKARERLLERMAKDALLAKWGTRVLTIWETEHLYQNPATEQSAKRTLCRAPGLLSELERRDELQVLHDAIARLDNRSAYIIRRRFGINDGIEFTLEQVAADLGITRERVRQVQAASLEKLKRWLGEGCASPVSEQTATTGPLHIASTPAFMLTRTLQGRQLRLDWERASMTAAMPRSSVADQSESEGDSEPTPIEDPASPDGDLDYPQITRGRASTEREGRAGRESARRRWLAAILGFFRGEDK